MTTTQIIEVAQQMLPYTSEFDHDVIRVPVSSKHLLEIEAGLQKLNDSFTFNRRFYEVEFRKLYIKEVAIGWEFVNIY